MSNDQRKNLYERRLNERRKNWEVVKQLGPDADFWKFEGRRKYGYDRRKKQDKRTVKDRRKSERRKKERRGNPLFRPPHDSRYLPEHVVEARAVSGGIKRDRLSLVSPEKLAEPTPKYRPPASKRTIRKGSEEFDGDSPFEETFPGFLPSLKSAGRAVRGVWDLFLQKRRQT